MIQNVQFKIPEIIWYGETPQSPNIPEKPDLVFRVVQATSDLGPTVALMAAYYLGSPFTEYYGGQLMRAIWIVAVDEQNGRVYQADLNGPDHLPIMIEASDEVAEAAMPGWSFESAHFNVDLAALLGLPEQSGRYRVFLWLDDIVSSIKTVDVPANPARGKGRPVASQTSQLVQFGPDPKAPKVQADNIVLALSGEPDDMSIHGAWTPQKGVDPHQVVLWILATSHRDRNFGWVAIRADESPTNIASASFCIDALKLVRTSGIEQKIFVLGLSTTSISKVVVMRAK
ncbi:MAG: hypothetical protein ACETWQ_06905 [Phycisphaerae bacterium]